MEFQNWFGACESLHMSEFVEAPNAESFLNLLGGPRIISHITKGLINVNLFVVDAVQG